MRWRNGRPAGGGLDVEKPAPPLQALDALGPRRVRPALETRSRAADPQRFDERVLPQLAHLPLVVRRAVPAPADLQIGLFQVNGQQGQPRRGLPDVVRPSAIADGLMGVAEHERKPGCTARGARSPGSAVRRASVGLGPRPTLRDHSFRDVARARPPPRVNPALSLRRVVRRCADSGGRHGVTAEGMHRPTPTLTAVDRRRQSDGGTMPCVAAIRIRSIALAARPAASVPVIGRRRSATWSMHERGASRSTRKLTGDRQHRPSRIARQRAPASLHGLAPQLLRRSAHVAQASDRARRCRAPLVVVEHRRRRTRRRSPPSRYGLARDAG